MLSNNRNQCRKPAERLEKGYKLISDSVLPQTDEPAKNDEFSLFQCSTWISESTEMDGHSPPTQNDRSGSKNNLESVIENLRIQDHRTFLKKVQRIIQKKFKAMRKGYSTIGQEEDNCESSSTGQTTTQFFQEDQDSEKV